MNKIERIYAFSPMDIILKLIGPVRPTEEQNIDDKRLENLSELIVLTEELVDIINQIANDQSNCKSAQDIIEKAKESINYIENIINGA